MPTTELTADQEQIVRDALAQLETIRETVASFEGRIAKLERQEADQG